MVYYLPTFFLELVPIRSTYCNEPNDPILACHESLHLIKLHRKKKTSPLCKHADLLHTVEIIVTPFKSIESPKTEPDENNQADDEE